jgi:putative transposase
MDEKSTTGATTSSPTWETLGAWLRAKLQEWVQLLLDEELTELLGRQKSERRATVDAAPGYRSGHGKPRRVTTPVGTLTVRRPRARNLEARFVSRILPLFCRRTQEVGEVLPQLYLHGLSLGDFDLALRGLLGDGAPLSPSSIARLRGKWDEEYLAWKERSLAEQEVVYLWADGIYVKAGLDRDKAALLVVIGARRDGTKVLLAVEGGYRESTEAWGGVLRDLKARGLTAPVLAIGDGHLGLWGALREVFPTTAEGRCWNHKLTNVLDQLPQRLRAQASALLRTLPGAETQAECERRRAQFTRRYGKSYPKAVETLGRDWEHLVTFYRFPKAHWKHLRTTNIVESPFAAVRLRTGAAKRFKKVANATALIWKVLRVAETRFRKLDAPHLLAEVADGVRFIDGERAPKQQTPRRLAA